MGLATPFEVPNDWSLLQSNLGLSNKSRKGQKVENQTAFNKGGEFLKADLHIHAVLATSPVSLLCAGHLPEDSLDEVPEFISQSANAYSSSPWAWPVPHGRGQDRTTSYPEKPYSPGGDTNAG